MRRPGPELQGLLEAVKAAGPVPDRTAAIRAARQVRQGTRSRATVDLKSKSIADTPVEEADEFDFSAFVRKLNTLRSGRSIKKNPDLRQNLDSYFNNLDESERTALVTFLDAVGKIIAADTHPASVPDPSDPPASVQMTRQKAEEIVREAIKRHLERRRKLAS